MTVAASSVQDVPRRHLTAEPSKAKSELDSISELSLAIFRKHSTEKQKELFSKEQQSQAQREPLKELLQGSTKKTPKKVQTSSEILSKSVEIKRPKVLVTPTKETYNINLTFGNESYFQFVITLFPKYGVKISYLSEIQIQEALQGKGIGSTVMEAYTKCLEALEVDIDYLHVISETEHTASLYHKKGYRFTHATTRLLEKHVAEGVESLLKNSSSSKAIAAKTTEPIEMYRIFKRHAFSGLTDPMASIKVFQESLER